MKALLVLLLLAVASCNTEIQEPELEFDVSGLIKCITEVAPLVPDVIEIINLIKAADWAQVAIKAVELVSKGIPAVKECIAAFKKELNLEASKKKEKNKKEVSKKELRDYICDSICKPFRTKEENRACNIGCHRAP